MKWLIACLAIVFAGPAGAADAVLWKNVGGWGVYVDRSLGDGCYAGNVWEDDTHLRVGFNPSADTLYVMFLNEKWRSLEVGKEYEIEIDFGRNDHWNGVFVGGAFSDGDKFLFMDGVKSEFVADFMKKTGIRISYEGRELSNLSLRGSYRAFLEALECQRMMGFQSTDDPFASSA